MQWVQVMVLGLLLGGVYAMMASGLPLLFGVMRVVNLAHAAFILVASYITYTLFENLALDPMISLVVTMPVMFGLGVVLFAVSPAPALAAGALALSGVAFLGAITSVTTRMQRGIAEDMRGRVMALWGVAFLGSRPVAALINGAIADAAGPRTASVLAAAVALMGALVLWVSRRTLNGDHVREAVPPPLG